MIDSKVWHQLHPPESTVKKIMNQKWDKFLVNRFREKKAWADRKIKYRYEFEIDPSFFVHKWTEIFKFVLNLILLLNPHLCKSEKLPSENGFKK